MPRKSAKNTAKQSEEKVDLNRTIPEIDECRFLIKKVIEQAVRDFSALEHAVSTGEQADYQSACEFLFDEDYCLNWGGQEMSLQDLLDWVDLNAEWVRKKARLAKERRKQKVLLREEAKRRDNDDNDTEESILGGVDGVQR